MPRFWEVTWSHSYSPVLDKNITEVVPTMLRLDEYYIEVSGVVVEAVLTQILTRFT